MEEPYLLRKLATVSTFANNFSEQLVNASNGLNCKWSYYILSNW